MRVRMMFLGAAALLLAGCGGEEYPVPAGEAASLLAGLGHTPAVSPMPVALEEVKVSFESLPGGNAVQWAFTHDGDELGQIVAMVEPSGEAASKVTVDYVEGSAPDGKLNNGKFRAQLKGGVKQLVVEAIDATLERRPFNTALRSQVDASITAALMGAVIDKTYSGINAALAKQDRLDKERANAPNYVHERPVPQDASKPTSDLSKFN